MIVSTKLGGCCNFHKAVEINVRQAEVVYEVAIKLTKFRPGWFCENFLDKRFKFPENVKPRIF